MPTLQNIGRKDTLLKSTCDDDRAHEEHPLDLDEIAPQGAGRMVAKVLEVEVQAYIDTARDHSTSEDTLWFFAMVTLGNARLSYR